MDTKRCSKCKKDLPFGCFGKDRHSKDGHYHYCRDCNQERQAKYKKPVKNTEPARTSQEAYGQVYQQEIEIGTTRHKANKIALTATTKRCRKCNEHKELEHFGINKYQADGLNYYCLECERQRVKKYGKADGCQYCHAPGPDGLPCAECSAIYSEAWGQARAAGATKVEAARYAKKQREILR